MGQRFASGTLHISAFRHRGQEAVSSSRTQARGLHGHADPTRPGRLGLGCLQTQPGAACPGSDGGEVGKSFFCAISSPAAPGPGVLRLEAHSFARGHTHLTQPPAFSPGLTLTASPCPAPGPAGPVLGMGGRTAMLRVQPLPGGVPGLSSQLPSPQCWGDPGGAGHSDR